VKLNILLIGGFLIVAILCGVVGYIAIDTFGNVEEVNAELQADIVPSAILMVEAQKKANKVHLKEMEYIVYRKYKEKAVEIKEELKKAMDELKELVDKHFEFARHISKEKRKNAQQFLDEVAIFNYAVNGIIAFIDFQVGYTEEINKQIAEMEEETVGSAYRVLAENLMEHKIEHMQELEDANKTVTEAHITSRNTILVTTLIIIILAIALGLFISCSITKPITKLREGAIEIGKGKIETKIEITSKNEIGELATAFNQMTENLKKITASRDELNKEITEREQAEEEVNRLHRFLQNISDSMPSVLVGVDLEGRVTHWNLRAEAVTGVTSEDAQSQLIEKVFPAMETQMEKVRQVIQERRPHKEERKESYVDGEKHFSDVVIYPLTTNGAEGAVIRVDDVTSRVRIEQMMVQSEKMLSVGGVAAGMAQEINNPLAGILQSAQVILEQLSQDLPANRKAAEESGTSMETINTYMGKRRIPDLLEAVLTSGKRAADIVESMLNFSRKSESAFAPENLAELLDRTVVLAGSDYDLKKKFDFRQIRIEREYDADLPKVVCEGKEIQQVLLNILRNGAQVMAEQKSPAEPPQFIVRTFRDGDMARVEIEDNGPGMSEEVRRRVLEPFFTTKEVGVGTGLGLSVSYFIISQNHGGTMTVESTPGKGAKFIIALPLGRRA